MPLATMPISFGLFPVPCSLGRKVPTHGPGSAATRLSPVKPLPLDFTLETERLRLRIPNESDIPHVFSASRVAGFNDGMLWNPPETEEELRGPLERATKAWQEAHSYQFTFETKEDRAFVGRISLRPPYDQLAPEDFGGAENALELGYWTHPDQQGRGYMTEAVNAVVRLGFETLEVDALVALHTLWNDASQRVLEKAGFRRIRVYREGFVKNGIAHDEALVRLDRADWSALPR